MSKLLFISPHLDDVVLSCGARILHAVQQRQNVHVLTVFTEPGNKVPESIRCAYQNRRMDDHRAINLLGAKPLHLGFVDAPFRNPKYCDFSSLLFHHRLAEIDFPIMKAVTNQLRRMITELSPDKVFFPLGVGGHVDHHIVFESSQRLLNVDAQVIYFEDLPYALVPNWTAVRWQQLNSHPKGLPVDFEQNIQKPSLLDIQLPFVHNYMASNEDRMRAIIKYQSECDALKPGMINASEWNLKKTSFFSEPYFTESDYYLKQKCKAISLYASEWALLFGPKESDIQKVLGSITFNNSYQEIYWNSKK